MFAYTKNVVVPLTIFLCGIGFVFAMVSGSLAIINQAQGLSTESCPLSEANESSINSWWGIWLTVGGNIINGIGISVQTHVHRKSSSRSYMCVARWWVGFLLVVIGETANAASYGIAPTNIVAPLGSISLIVVDIVAFCIFREPVYFYNVTGAFIIIVGVSLCTWATPHVTNLYTASNLIRDILFSSESVIWFLILVIFLLTCSLVMNPLYGKRYVIVTASMSAALSGITIIACRGFFSMVVLTSKDCAGDVCYNTIRPPCFETIGSWLFWALCGVVLITSFVSNGVLEQQGLANFEQSRFVPVHFGCCAIIFVACGGIVYNDFGNMSDAQIGVFWGGLSAVLLGVAIISGFRPASE